MSADSQNWPRWKRNYRVYNEEDARALVVVADEYERQADKLHAMHPHSDLVTHFRREAMVMRTQVLEFTSLDDATARNASPRKET